MTLVSRPAGVSVFVAEASAWLLVTVVLTMFHVNASSDDEQFRIMAVAAIVSIVFGVRVFLGNGGARITPVGLWGVAGAMFFGAAGFLTAISNDRQIPPYHVTTALLLCLTVQIAVTVFAWPTTRELQACFPEQRTAQRLAMVGGGTFLLLIGAKLTMGPKYAAMLEHTAFTAIILLCIGLLWRERTRLRSWSMLLILACTVIYAGLFHIGSGRLRIVALACALGLLVTMRFPRRWLKAAAVLAAPIALLWLAETRLSLQESLGATADRRSGLESMIQPLLGFGRLLQAQGEEGFELRWGSTILSYPATITPDWLFDGGPTALGYELVQLWSPSRYGTGYSVGATVVGESVYNFGPLFGVLIAIPVIALALRLLDRALTASAARTGAGAMSLLALAVCAMLAGAVGDLVWGGQHVFLTRTTLRLIVIAAVAAATVTFNPRHVSDGTTADSSDPCQPYLDQHASNSTTGQHVSFLVEGEHRRCLNASGSRMRI